MINDNEILINELGGEIPKGKGCMILDLSCFFPYRNQDVLTFDFKLGSEEPEPYKHNHRYPNNSYVTISKKMGRKVSKLGYPVLVDLVEDKYILLTITIGIKDKTIDLIFPIYVALTEDKPVCVLNFAFNFKNSNFSFMSYYYEPQIDGWKFTEWTNYDKDDSNKSYRIVMGVPTDIPTSMDNKYCAVYHNVISPHSQSLEKCFLK